jgi:hypothetical protein
MILAEHTKFMYHTAFINHNYTVMDKRLHSKVGKQPFDKWEATISVLLCLHKDIFWTSQHSGIKTGPKLEEFILLDVSDGIMYFK